MDTSNKSDQSIPVTPKTGELPLTNIWLHLYGASLTGVVSRDVECACSPAGLAADAADIADEASRLIAKRQELLKLARAVVDQPEPDDS